MQIWDLLFCAKNRTNLCNGRLYYVRVPGASSNTSYIVRFFNMKPGSSWDVLVASLLTGSNKDAKENFDSSVPLFINFQLSKSKNHLAKVVRDAKKARGIAKYGMDQKVRVTVKVSPYSNTGSDVPSEEDLTALVMAAPPPHSNSNR